MGPDASLPGQRCPHRTGGDAPAAEYAGRASHRQPAHFRAPDGRRSGGAGRDPLLVRRQRSSGRRERRHGRQPHRLLEPPPPRSSLRACGTGPRRFRRIRRRPLLDVEERAPRPAGTGGKPGRESEHGANGPRPRLQRCRRSGIHCHHHLPEAPGMPRHRRKSHARKESRRLHPHRDRHRARRHRASRRRGADRPGAHRQRPGPEPRRLERRDPVRVLRVRRPLSPGPRGLERKRRRRSARRHP